VYRAHGRPQVYRPSFRSHHQAQCFSLPVQRAPPRLRGEQAQAQAQGQGQGLGFQARADVPGGSSGEAAGSRCDDREKGRQEQRQMGGPWGHEGARALGDAQLNGAQGPG